MCPEFWYRYPEKGHHNSHPGHLCLTGFGTICFRFPKTVSKDSIQLCHGYLCSYIMDLYFKFRIYDHVFILKIWLLYDGLF